MLGLHCLCRTVSNYATAKTLIVPKAAIAVTVLIHVTLELAYQEQCYCKNPLFNLIKNGNVIWIMYIPWLNRQ